MKTIKTILTLALLASFYGMLYANQDIYKGERHGHREDLNGHHKEQQTYKEDEDPFEYVYMLDIKKLKKAKRIAIESETFIQHCQPCIDEKPNDIRFLTPVCKVEKVKTAKIMEAYNDNNKQFYVLLINGMPVDLASLYPANRYIRLGRYTNMAQKVGLNTRRGVPRSITADICWQDIPEPTVPEKNVTVIPAVQ